MIAPIKKPRRRTPTDGGASPLPAAHHLPPLTPEQAHALREVYALILAHGSGAGVP